MVDILADISGRLAALEGKSLDSGNSANTIQGTAMAKLDSQDKSNTVSSSQPKDIENTNIVQDNFSRDQQRSEIMPDVAESRICDAVDKDHLSESNDKFPGSAGSARVGPSLHDVGVVENTLENRSHFMIKDNDVGKIDLKGGPMSDNDFAYIEGANGQFIKVPVMRITQGDQLKLQTPNANAHGEDYRRVQFTQQETEDAEHFQFRQDYNMNNSSPRQVHGWNQHNFDVIKNAHNTNAYNGDNRRAQFNQQEKEDAEHFQFRQDYTMNNSSPRQVHEWNQPNFDVIKNAPGVMQQAAARLNQLGLTKTHDGHLQAESFNPLNKGRRSGSICKASDKIVMDMDWPHYHITRGVNLVPSSYEELTQEEFQLGYIRMLRDPDSQFNMSVMLEILEDLLEDTVDFGWQNVKGYYKSLGLEVERGKLRWSDKAAIQKRRFTQCRVIKSVQKPNSEKKQTRQVPLNSQCCAMFNSNACTHKGDHAPYIHSCTYCFNNKNVVNRHKEQDCFFKMRELSKNGN